MTNNSHRLFMFVVLSLEMEKWGLALKGTVKHDFKMKLNAFLDSSSQLRRFCEKHINMDDFEDISETYSRILEKLTEENRDEFMAMCNAYFNNEIQVIDDALPNQ